MNDRESPPAPSHWSTTIRLILTIVVCAVVAVIVTGPGWQPRAFGRNFGISLIFAIATAVPAYLVLNKIGPKCGRLPAPWNWIVFLTACVIVAIIGCLISVAVLALIGLFPWSAYWNAFKANQGLCIVITLAFGSGNFLYETFRGRLDRARLAEERARFASLESRIHPHFLFNTLNSISALIREDPRKAERTVEQLAALLRYSLEMNASRLAPMRNEMRIVTDYLDIEKTRFGDRLRYTIDVPASIEDVAVPPMAIQTLVENSIKHAIARTRQGGEVRISARLVADQLEIDVSDDGPGFTPGDIEEGHGLDSLRDRLVSLFGRGASLEISSAAGGATVRLSLPSKRVLL